jgi:hypothetical protein
MEPNLIVIVIWCSVAPLHTVSTFELCIGHKLLFTLSSLSLRLNQLSLLLPTLDGRTLPCRFYDSWVRLGCWPHAECWFSTFWCVDRTPPASSSYLVTPLVVDVGDLEAWTGVGSSNGSVGPPLFSYGCTPFFISNGSKSLSSLQSTVDAPSFFFFLLIDGPSFVDGAWRPVLYLLTCDPDKYIGCFLYSYMCVYIYIYI